MTSPPTPRDDTSVPVGLRAAVERELRPVVALAPAHRLVALFPVALFLLFAPVVALGLRRDAPRPGPRICVAGTYASALPALLLSGWLVARAFPLRPGLAGALYGLGAGLLADAGWRRFCHFSDPVHVFGAHTLAIGLATVSGVALAQLAGRRRRR